jgi:hypothetical protein
MYSKEETQIKREFWIEFAENIPENGFYTTLK